MESLVGCGYVASCFGARPTPKQRRNCRDGVRGNDGKWRPDSTEPMEVVCVALRAGSWQVQIERALAEEEESQ